MSHESQNTLDTKTYVHQKFLPKKQSSVFQLNSDGDRFRQNELNNPSMSSLTTVEITIVRIIICSFMEELRNQVNKVTGETQTTNWLNFEVAPVIVVQVTRWMANFTFQNEICMEFERARNHRYFQRTQLLSWKWIYIQWMYIYIINISNQCMLYSSSNNISKLVWRYKLWNMIYEILNILLKMKTKVPMWNIACWVKR